MSSHEIAHLIHQYGLIAVFLAAGLQAIGLPIPGGTALAAAGIDASTKRGLPLVGVILSATAGALLGTAIGFALGRWRGEAILLRLGRLVRQKPERVQKLRRQFQERAVAPVFIARFITGARNVAGLVAGSGGMAFPLFLAVSAAACLIWASVIAVEYYFAGRAIVGAPTWLQALLILLGLAITVVLFRLLRGQAADRGEQVREAADPETARPGGADPDRRP